MGNYRPVVGGEACPLLVSTGRRQPRCTSRPMPLCKDYDKMSMKGLLDVAKMAKEAGYHVMTWVPVKNQLKTRHAVSLRYYI